MTPDCSLIRARMAGSNESRGRAAPEDPAALNKDTARLRTAPSAPRLPGHRKQLPPVMLSDDVWPDERVNRFTDAVTAQSGQHRPIISAIAIQLSPSSAKDARQSTRHYRKSVSRY